MTAPRPTSPPYPEEVSAPDPTSRKLLGLTKVLSWLVLAYFLAVEVLLLLGFLLLLLGANPDAGFVEWVYRSLGRAMEPFRGIFTPIELGTTRGGVPSIFETSVLFAMVVYGLLALAAHALVTWLGAKVARMDLDAREYRYQQMLKRAAAQQQQASTAAPAPSVYQPPPPPPGA